MCACVCVFCVHVCDSESIYSGLMVVLIDRMHDKVAFVREAAVTAACRLQQAEQHDDDDDDEPQEDEIMNEYAALIRNDTSRYNTYILDCTTHTRLHMCAHPCSVCVCVATVRCVVQCCLQCT